MVGGGDAAAAVEMVLTCMPRADTAMGDSWKRRSGTGRHNVYGGAKGQARDDQDRRRLLLIQPCLRILARLWPRPLHRRHQRKWRRRLPLGDATPALCRRLASGAAMGTGAAGALHRPLWWRVGVPTCNECWKTLHRRITLAQPRRLLQIN